MAKACIHHCIYFRILNGACLERVCAVRAVPYADMADANAFRGVWNTDSEDECESEEVVADGAGAGGCRLFGVELV